MGTTLDIAIGLFCVYLLLSVLCSAIHEAVAGVLRLRAANLVYCIERLLADPALEQPARRLLASLEEAPKSAFRQMMSNVRSRMTAVRPPHPLALAFRRHPLIQSLQQGWVGPSYIPSHTFVAALLDTLRQIDWAHDLAPEARDARPDPQDPMEDVRALLARLPPGSTLRRSLSALLDGTARDMRAVHARLERWFNDAMDRAAGRYKRLSQMLITTTALVLAVGFNADSIRIASALSRDAATRATVVLAAQNMVKAPTAAAPAEGESPGVTLEQIGEVEKRLSDLDLHITWGNIVPDEEKPGASPANRPGTTPLTGALAWLRGLLKRILNPGILVTTAAASLGAPFWFDLLNKLVNLRTTGKSPTQDSAASDGK